VKLTEESLTFNTTMISGWDEPETSVVLPLQEFKNLPVNSTINVLIDVFRKASDILPLGTME